MYPNEKGRVQASNLITLVVSLGLCDDSEQVSEILRGISEGLSINVISFSKLDLQKICEDGRTDFLLKQIMKEASFNGGSKLSALVQVLKKWWNKIDKSQNGFVPIDDIVKTLTDVGAVGSTSDIKRMYLKMGQFGNFKQFCSVFSKSLFKFLLAEVSCLVDQGGNKFVSADITLMEMRRKVILENLTSRGKITSSISACESYTKPNKSNN
jgi:Ca2+-binding EF-hand superfamily protein